MSQQHNCARVTDGRAGAGRLLAVLALAAAPLALAGCGSSPPAPVSDAPTVHAGAAADVPWKALAPTYPKIPERTIPARPDPAAAEAAPPCRASDLRAGSELDGAGGTAYLSVTLRLAAGQPCRLSGRPVATLLDRGRPVRVPMAATTGDDLLFNYPDPVLVAPGRPALLSLGWASDWCADPLQTDSVRVELPGGGGTFTLPGFHGTPGCTERVEDLSPAERHTTPVRVSTFAPRRARPARVVSRYDGVDVEARRASKPRTGQPFDFVVTLTARKDIALDPCPDYTIAQYLGGQQSREDRYALNCAAVPTKDAEGRPYLPAGRPVTFAMRVRLLDETAGLKFVWQLETPDQGAGAAGLVVSRAG